MHDRVDSYFLIDGKFILIDDFEGRLPDMDY